VKNPLSLVALMLAEGEPFQDRIAPKKTEAPINRTKNKTA